MSRCANGAVLDHMRRFDYLSRNERDRCKAMQRAAPGEDPHSITEAELAAATGMTAARVRQVLHAEAVGFPVPLEVVSSTSVSGSEVQREVLDHDADAEAQRGATELLGALVRAVEAPPYESQVIVVLTVYQGMSEENVAAQLDMEPADVTRLLDQAALSALDAMRAAATVSD